MATSYSFPLFNNRDIASFFCDRMNPPIRITEGDLKEIKAPVALRLYTGFWEAIMDEDAETVFQPRFDVCTATHPELHEPFIQRATFAMALRWLLSQAGASDFNLMDLKDPKSKRTNKFLSALMNYYLFVLQRVQVWDEMKAQKEEEDEMVGSLKDANDALQRQIDELKHARAAEEPQRVELAAKADLLESDLNELVLNKRKLVQKISDVKGKISKMSEDTDRTEELLIKKRAEVLAMDAQIIQSPARMKVDIQNMVEKKSKVRSRQTEQQERLTEIERKTRDEDKFLKDTEGALKMVKEVGDLLERETLLIDDRADLDSKVTEVQTRCSELHWQLEALEEECENRQEKQQRAGVSKQVRISSLKADIQAREGALERLKETAEKKMHEHQSRIRDIQNVEEHAQRRIVDQNQQHEMMKSKYAELLEALDKYHTRLASQHRTTTDKLRQYMSETSRAENSENSESSQNSGK